MRRMKRLIIVSLLFFLAVAIDTAMFLIKKAKRILFFPGG